MPELPEPLSSDPQEFSTVVGLVAELLADGKVRLKTSPAANISYSIDQTLLEDTAEKKGIDSQAARLILSEISGAASVILRSRTERFIDHIIERDEEETRLSDEEKKQVRSILLEKIKLVEEQLVTPRVRQRFHSARASKHDSLVDIRWEITDRRYDKEEGDKARGPIAIFRFETSGRPEFEFYPFFLGADEFPRRSLVIECDEDDIDSLIDTLTEAKARLALERSK